MVISALARLHPEMSRQRREHLDALLKKVGRKAFRMSDTALTPAAVRGSVVDGRLPSARGGEDLQFFRTAAGQIEVDDDHATFNEGLGHDIVSASANAESAATQPAVVTPTVGTPMPMPMGPPKINVSGAAVAGVIAESIASVLLYILL